MRILIIGSGNYVTGRGTNSYGTILPAIYEFNKEKKIVDEVVILTTSKKSAKLAQILIKSFIIKSHLSDKKFR